ncbi:RIC1-domain-containing protein [Halteromyces radiatus]|uniref:RIC1-domain-containing protein n=1 Tax=Halteromyces radiatus TaxID=101107 RepID=UPI00222044A0|nr:RIC1-domain-containing protein [Halteromyces radiatus]KAI8089450.1 RIC1-domain-containing protein [Halteromyces radiatus]
MYWINGIASEICLTSTLVACLSTAKETIQLESSSSTTNDKGKSREPSFSSSAHIITMQPSYHASFFVTCTHSDIHLWSIKPTVILSFVKRSNKHVEEFGKNKSILWKPDGSSFVVLTDRNYLLLYVILSYDQQSLEFQFPTSHHAYVTGPGEGKGARTMLIKFRLAIRVDAGVTCGSCTDDTLIIGTQKPAAIQCISWNPQQTNSTQTSVQHRLGIFLDQDEHVKTMLYDKLMNISVWITNVGRVYLIQNKNQRRGSKSSTKSESDDHPSTSPSAPSFTEPIHWFGRCFHGASTTSSYDPATCIAINAKFSLIAVGTSSGSIYVYTVRNYTSTPLLSHQMRLPMMSMTATSAAATHTNGYGSHVNSSSSLLSQVPSSTSNLLDSYQGRQQNKEDISSLYHNKIGSVQTMAWSLDGYALSVGFMGHGGLAMWSVYGALLCSMDDIEDLMETQDGLSNTQDLYVNQINSMFWGPGSHQLFVLSQDNQDDEISRLYTLPFAKSALTTFHNSDNARRGLLQMDDRLLLYNNGGDYQENNTNTIDPDAVAWTHILYPSIYITEHWPIRYASISPDGKFIAIAGRRGLAHFSTLSSRWKLFGNQQQEQQILVRGGLVWYKQILIAPCEVISSGYGSDKTYEIYMYSRDQNLDQAHALFTEPLEAIPIYITTCGNFLLVYTLDNQLSIYAIHYVENNIGATHIDLVRQIFLTGIVARPARVRGISLFHGECGDRIQSIDEVVQYNIILLVDGNLMMLSPKFASDDDNDSDLIEQHEIRSNSSGIHHTTYDSHVLMEKVEYYWIGQKGIANLWTSIWAVDGKGVKVFTNVLRGEGYGFYAFNKDHNMTILESEPSTPTTPIGPGSNGYHYRDIGARPYSLGYRIGVEPSSPHSQCWMDMEGESKWQTDLHQLEANAIYIPLDFYPHAILLDKGVIVGMEQNIIYKNTLGYLLYKSTTKTHLFLHHLIRYLLQRQLEEDAVVFARAYERLIYFGHALEILLHTVLEEETERPRSSDKDAILPLVIRFLDQFPHALDVIVSCARKTEVALWDHLFASVGKPEDLFELCLTDGRLRTATSYLIILQTMQPHNTGGKDTIRLLQKAMDVDDYELCKELVRFLSSIDHTGKTLHEALVALQTRMVEKANGGHITDSTLIQGIQDL